MLIGVISDTHGLLRPEALAALDSVEHIIHAGDIGSPGILPRLAEIAPITAIRGNIDTGWIDLAPHSPLDFRATKSVSVPTGDAPRAASSARAHRLRAFGSYKATHPGPPSKPKDRTMPKLSDTQTILLSAAAIREDGSLLPLPEGLKTRGAALDRTLNSLLRRGMITTITADMAEKTWERGDADDDQGSGGGTGLAITAAGFAALGIEPPTSETSEREAVSGPDSIEAETPVVADTPRPRGKLGAVIDAIARPEGASLEELTALSGWLPHTTRAAVTRLRQRGHGVTLRKIEGRKAYHLAAKA